ncbi:type II toxin-antitoxin system RelB/DinJ family antitoxin [Patescibacteria group bacterium]|nr:type II toxin-antitoxin system RelB/DinJ family antitoxin [Patescibacteria group bacterium]MBP9710605.1 type II toxin-antitoxin system RelB/DinJ family antitoxin [Patescibacteria group bacterium]
MTTIQVRIDEQTKKASSKILAELGLDLSSAIKVYLKQVIATKGIPFSLLTKNGFTQAEEALILQASREAKQGKNISPGMKTAAQVIDYLHAKK